MDEQTPRPPLFSNRFADAVGPGDIRAGYDTCACFDFVNVQVPEREVHFHSDRQDTSAPGWAHMLALIDEAAADGRGQPEVHGGVLAARASGAWRLFLVLALAVAVMAADQATKAWALSRLAGHRAIALPGGWVDLRLISNPGAAFSFGSGATWLFTLSAAAAVAIVPWVAARFRGRVMALGLLMGGAGGNLLDRFFRAPGPGRGRVVDFIDYHGWFIGNVADIAIVAAAGVLIVQAVTPPRPRVPSPINEWPVARRRL